MDHKTNWIENQMEFADKLNSVKAPEHLLRRLESIPRSIKESYDLVPKRTIWLAAATIAVLIALNVLSAQRASKSNSNSDQFTDTYFSHSYTL